MRAAAPGTIDSRALALVLAALVVTPTLASCDAAPPQATAPPRPTQPEGWDDDVRVAEAVDTDPADDVVAVTLEARLATLELTPGVQTEVWTYDGQLPGPTIRAKRGDRVVVTFTNSLPDPTTVHWHGLRVDAAMDGTDLMQDPVQPGETFTYELDLLDAGTFWYHPHIDSSAQVGYGLYGAFIVDDPDEQGRQPRHDAPLATLLGDELVLVLSDMSLDEDGQLRPGDHQGWFGDYFGRQGALSLTNGKALPVLRARAGAPQRWRVINASRAKYQRLQAPGSTFILVAGDGGLLARPFPDADVVLPPGARAEIVFAPGASQRDAFTVENLGVDVFHTGTPPVGNAVLEVQVAGDSDSAVALPVSVPDALRALEPLDVEGATEREVVLDTAVGEDGNSYFAINGALGHADAFVARMHTTEVWTLRNTTNQDHPFHLHGFFFRVLEATGSIHEDHPAMHGWLDTLNLEPNDELRIAIPFDDRVGKWMFHCHILDHADAGMMGAVHLEESDDVTHP